jgi:hypothetical protein
VAQQPRLDTEHKLLNVLTVWPALLRDKAVKIYSRVPGKIKRQPLSLKLANRFIVSIVNVYHFT